MFSRSAQRRTRKAREFVWPAPVAGLVKSGSVVGGDPRAAEVLENFIPTAEGARMRGGCEKHATVGAEVQTLFAYQSGSAERFFAATETTLTDVTSTADPDAELIPTISGLRGGKWSTVQFGTAGGQFVVAVNGENCGFRYDGTNWNVMGAVAQNQVSYDGLTAPFIVGQTITAGSSHATLLAVLPSSATAGTFIIGAITGGPFSDNVAVTSDTGAAVINGTSSSRSALTFTGIQSCALSFVWSHKKRLWFVEKGALSAWYLPVNSIAGEAVEFPLDGVFRLGGSLLFGGTWSTDSGSGMDDLIVFITTEGEVAVYEGVDPGDADAWSLIGAYVIGKPLAKDGWFRAGGDLVVLTEDGIVSVSEAMRKDRAALQSGAVTAPIEAIWNDAVALGQSSFPVALWSTTTTLWVGVPSAMGGRMAIVANTKTGAWATVSGWPATAFCVFGDDLYFGAEDGSIARCDTSGSDMGAPYSAVYVPKFQEFGSMAEKFAIHAQWTIRSAGKVYPAIAALRNFDIDSLPPPIGGTDGTVSLWGSAIWGSAVWGSKMTTQTGRVSVTGFGTSLSLAVVIGSSGISAPGAEIVALQLRYEAGETL